MCTLSGREGGGGGGGCCCCSDWMNLGGELKRQQQIQKYLSCVIYVIVGCREKEDALSKFDSFILF